jgi:hypothetical protein
MGFAADLDVSCASSSVTHCIFHFKASFVLVELVSFTFELLRGSEMKLAAN